MKKYFFLAAAALIAMSACTKVEVNSAPDEQISFAPATYLAQTKADTGGHANHGVVPGNFGVYAWFTPASATENQINQVFMSNQAVTPQGTTVNHVYYWPKTGSVDFVGYYPYGTCWFGVSSNPKAAAKYVASTQTIIPATGTTPDLMYADEVTASKNPESITHYYAGVPMLFHHALSQLTVNVQQDPMTITKGEETTKFDITIKKVTIANIKNTGSVEIAFTSPATVWTPDETAARYTKTWETEQDLTNSSVVYDDFSKMLVMPQDLQAKSADPYQSIYVKYTLVTTRQWLASTDPAYQISEDVEVTLPFYSSITKWEMGKSYTYNLKFIPADDTVILTFDPAVVDWVSGGSVSL